MSNKQGKRFRVAAGVEDFRKLVTNYNVYVDKTLFIKEIVDTDDQALLITRPRRWGKSMNLDMLKAFFKPDDQPCHHGGESVESNARLFDGMKIATATDRDGNDIISAYRGKYPVIFASLKDVSGNSIEEIRKNLGTLMRNLFIGYDYLQNSPKLSDFDKEDFKKYANADKNYSDILLEDGMRVLCDLLFKHHNQHVYILIDEYDKPVNSLLEDEHYLGSKKTEENARFLRKVVKMISSTVCGRLSKNNPSLKQLILIGITDTLLKESGSGCNNLSVYGVADIKFSTSFGFYEEEVVKLVEQLGFENKDFVLETLADWYNGYIVPISTNETARVYNPWSVMKYLRLAYEEGEFDPQSYWTASGASTILDRLLTKEKCSKSTVITKLTNMTRANAVELEFQKLTSLIKYDWFNNIDNERVFSYLLLNYGYFTVKKNAFGRYEFSIPNAEISTELVELLNNLQTDDDVCGEVLQQAQKISHKKVVEMIRTRKTDGLAKELERVYTKCEDSKMMFNFFHLAAIFGSKELMQILLDSKCDEYAGFVEDKISGWHLRPIDYAYLLKRTEIIDLIEKHYNDNIGILMRAPGTIKSAFCFLYQELKGYKNDPESKISAATKVIGMFFGSGSLLDGVMGIASLGKSAIKKLAVEEACGSVSAYESIDASNPATFKTIKQVEKYHLLNPTSIVKVNDKCGDGYEELAKVSHMIFENTFYSDERIYFRLCGESPSHPNDEL